ncbi:tryptophan synthase beta subunit-like PLP-dependent enzyme [Lipomyces oligophaga]|uniref:tryptophan synthase beta subunit-like PLP-dependent enzyme n=1 Tax=Lipomyces oligophaga TaxID=45792 RepID=UPI0034CFF160
MAQTSTELSRAGVLAAQELIKGKIKETPVLTSTLISGIASQTAGQEIRLFFKCENFQKGGAFKIRGATHAIKRLTPEELRNGVVTHSSGNHGQAVAIAAQTMGTKAYIILPSNSAKPKIEGARSYGGEVHFSEPSISAREQLTEQIRQQTGASFNHPSDDANIILGQGTVFLEFENQVKESGALLPNLSGTLDAVITPVGGGGLLAGCALAAQGTGVRIFGAEPALADDCARGIAAGERIAVVPTSSTVADGLRSQVGAINFPIIQQNVEKVFTVSESEILAAMRLMWERLKIVVEPSSAVPLAVILSEDWRSYGVSGNIGIVLSGGNVDMDNVGVLLTSVPK